MAAIPGRRGNRSGVGPVLATTTNDRRSPGAGLDRLQRAAHLEGGSLDGAGVGLARPDHQAAAGPDQRQAQLDRDGRRRQRPADGQAEPVAIDAATEVFGTFGSDVNVVRLESRGDGGQHRGLLLHRLHELDGPVGPCQGQHHPGHARAGADVDDLAVGRVDQVQSGERVGHVALVRLLAGHGREPHRRVGEQVAEALQARVVHTCTE